MDQQGMEIISFGVHHGLFRDTLVKTIKGVSYFECKEKSGIYANLESKDSSDLIVLGSFNSNLKEETRFLKMTENVIRTGVIILISDNIKELHLELNNLSADRRVLLLKNSKDQIELVCQVQLLLKAFGSMAKGSFTEKVKPNEDYILKKVDFGKNDKKININTIKAIKKTQKVKIALLSSDEEFIEKQSEEMENENIAYEVFDSSEVALSSIRKASKKKEPYSAVLTNNHFNGMGLEIWLQVLQTDNILATIPVILVDGKGENKSLYEKVSKVFSEDLSYSELVKYLGTQELQQDKSEAELQILDLKVGSAEKKDGKNNVKTYDGAIQISDLDLQILVVDDYPAIRKAIASMLNKMGIRHVDLASGGQEATNKASETLYDYILMDIMMPEMDGIKATKKIREFDNEVTIIALTGEDDNHSKEACLGAGMNQFIPKPISLADLKRLIFADNNHVIVNGDDIEESAAQPQVVDTIEKSPSVFNKKDAIETFGGNTDLLSDIINKFMTETPARIEEMLVALEHKELEKISKLAAGIKGGTEYVGAERLKLVSQKLEMAGDNCDKNYFIDLVTSLRNEYVEFEQEVSRTAWK